MPHPFFSCKELHVSSKLNVENFKSLMVGETDL